MKYNVLGFKQEILVKEYTELNGTDIIVLRTMVDMLNRLPRTKTVGDKVYVQMTYKMLLEDLPCITDSLSTIKRIVQKFIKCKLIERYVFKQGGNYTYFRVTKKLVELEYSTKESGKQDEGQPNESGKQDEEQPNESGKQDEEQAEECENQDEELEKKENVEKTNMTEEQLSEKISLGSKEIIALAHEYGKVEVMQARQYVFDKYKNGNTIKNPLAYLKDVLKKGYYRW